MPNAPQRTLPAVQAPAAAAARAAAAGCDALRPATSVPRVRGGLHEAVATVDGVSDLAVAPTSGQPCTLFHGKGAQSKALCPAYSPQIDR